MAAIRPRVPTVETVQKLDSCAAEKSWGMCRCYYSLDLTITAFILVSELM